MELGLHGKVAIITGGSEGIGKVTARRFTQEGARVAIAARRPDVLEKAAQEIQQQTGGEVLAVPTDVRRAEDCQRLVDATVQRFGRVDILVNNAGVQVSLPFEEASDEVWADDFSLKVWPVVRLSRLCVPHMRRQGGGRIINIGNTWTKAPQAASVPTSVSRAADMALTKALSLDLAKDNILVNIVCFGFLKSAQHEARWRRAQAQDPSLTLDQFYAQEVQRRRIPLGRVGETEEGADIILFLASDRASYITGAAINVDGGVIPVV